MTEWYKDDEDFCFSCNEKSEVNEDGQCKICFDKGVVQCMSCSNCGDREDYYDMEDGDYHCEECYQPTCQYCNEYVEEEGDFCCDDCVKGFKYDMRDKCE